jgi:hypothetical protein
MIKMQDLDFTEILKANRTSDGRLVERHVSVNITEAVLSLAPAAVREKRYAYADWSKVVPFQHWHAGMVAPS